MKAVNGAFVPCCIVSPDPLSCLILQSWTPFKSLVMCTFCCAKYLSIQSNLFEILFDGLRAVATHQGSTLTSQFATFVYNIIDPGTVMLLNSYGTLKIFNLIE